MFKLYNIVCNAVFGKLCLSQMMPKSRLDSPALTTIDALDEAYMNFALKYIQIHLDTCRYAHLQNAFVLVCQNIIQAVTCTYALICRVNMCMSLDLDTGSCMQT